MYIIAPHASWLAATSGEGNPNMLSNVSPIHYERLHGKMPHYRVVAVGRLCFTDAILLPKVEVPCTLRGRKARVKINLAFVLGMIVLVAFLVSITAFIVSRVSTLNGTLRVYYIAVEEM